MTMVVGVFVKVSLRPYMLTLPPSGPWLAYKLQSIICSGVLASSAYSKLPLIDDYFTATFPVDPTTLQEGNAPFSFQSDVLSLIKSLPL
jgi:hypothetical protein